MASHLFKIAIKNVLSKSNTSVLSMLGLTIAFISIFYIYSYVSFELGYDSQHEKSDRIYRISGDIIASENIMTHAKLGPSMGFLNLSSNISKQKTKEIGIRKVNGATTSEILIMLNKDFIKWVAIAFVFACPIAYYAMDNWLQNFAYKINLNWWIFVLSGFIALLIALITVSWQTFRTALKNPVEALRYE